MLSQNNRDTFLDILQKISLGREVSLEEMKFVQKLAGQSTEMKNLLTRARRQAIQGKGEKGSLDEFLDQLNFGEPDPSTHITRESSIDDLANFFMRGAPQDWRQTD